MCCVIFPISSRYIEALNPLQNNLKNIITFFFPKEISSLSRQNLKKSEKPPVAKTAGRIEAAESGRDLVRRFSRQVRELLGALSRSSPPLRPFPRSPK